MRCAMCLSALPRWFWGMRAPLCVWCKDSAGPVRHPSLWDAGRLFSSAGRAVWQTYAEVA